MAEEPTEVTTEEKTRSDDQAADAAAAAEAKAASSVLDNDGGDKEVTAPADWPDDWRQKLAGDDAKFLGILNRYTSPQTFARAYQNLRAQRDSGALKPALSDKATPEELAQWRKDNGIPEKAADYLAALPDGLVIGADDRPRVETFVQAMHEKNAPPALVHEALGWYYQTIEQEQAARAEQDEAARVETIDTLRTEWGADYRREMNRITSLLDGAPEGVKDKIFGARAPDGVPLGSDPGFLRFLAQMAREVNPAATVVPGAANPGAAIADEIASIEAMMGNQQSEYWTGPKADKYQARYRELISARDKSAA